MGEEVPGLTALPHAGERIPIQAGKELISEPGGSCWISTMKMKTADEDGEAALSQTPTQRWEF